MPPIFFDEAIFEWERQLKDRLRADERATAYIKSSEKIELVVAFVSDETYDSWFDFDY